MATINNYPSYIAGGKFHFLGHAFDLYLAPRYLRALLTADLSAVQLWGSDDNVHWRLLQEQPHHFNPFGDA